MGIIDINSLSFSYSTEKVFNELTLSIKEGSFTTILGNNGSGKTTLIKLLLGFEKSFEINIFDRPLSRNIRNVRNQIGVIFDDPSLFFVFDTVREELEFSTLNLNMTPNEKELKILNIVKELKIERLLQLNPKNISFKEQCLVALAICLLTESKIIILDDVLSRTNDQFLKKMLKKANKSGVTILNFTTEPEEIFLGNNNIIISEGKVVFSGTTKKLLNHLDVFKSLNIDLPFMIDLSNKLIFYELIEKIYINMGKMVNDIWK